MAADQVASTAYHQRLQKQAQAVRSLLTTGDYADFRLTCNDYTWPVHKGVLCTQCDFFKKALDGTSKVATCRSQLRLNTI